MWSVLTAILSLPFCGFFFQAEDGIRDVERSRGLGDVYKRQVQCQTAKLPNCDNCVQNYDSRTRN